MSFRKYKFVENVFDPDTGEPVSKGESPRMFDLGEYGKRILHRIVKVQVSIQKVKGRSVVVERPGEKGGWVESELNLSQTGNCWISGNAKVFGTAFVSKDAKVSGDALVGEHAKVTDSASVSGNAIVCGSAYIYGSGSVSGGKRVAVSGKARVSGGVSGDAMVAGNARVYKGGDVSGKAKVGGRAILMGKVSGEAVVTDRCFVKGKVSGESKVIGNVHVLSAGSIEGRAIVTSGTVLGKVRGDSVVGGTNAISFTVPTEKKAKEQKEKWIEGWRAFIDAVWLMPQGLYSVLGNAGFVSVGFKDSKSAKEFAERTGFKQTKDGSFYLFRGYGYLFDAGEKGDRISLLHLQSHIATLFGSGPLILGGDLSDTAILAGGVVLNGEVKKNCIVWGTSYIEGKMNADDLVIEGNSMVGGKVQGKKISIYDSVCLGTMDGGNPVRSGTVVRVSMIGKRGSTKNTVDVEGSLVNGALIGNVTWTNMRGVEVQNLYVNDSIVAGGERFWGSKFESKYFYLLHSVPTVGRMHAIDDMYGALAKRHDEQYIKAQIAVDKWVEEMRKKHEDYTERFSQFRNPKDDLKAGAYRRAANNPESYLRKTLQGMGA